MNEHTRSSIDRSATSAVTNAEMASPHGELEPGQQSESEVASRPASEGASQPASEVADQSEVDSTHSTGRVALPLDETFELLRNQRRRYVLEYLQTAGGQVSLSELSEQIAAWENDKEVGQITSSERKRVYVGLYQCHLPKMDGMGVVTFNKSRGWIERGEHADAVEPYLDRAAAPERPSRAGPTVGLSIVGATVLPVAILQVSQSTLSLGLAALVVLLATLWGVAILRQAWPDVGALPVEPTVA